MGILNDKPHEKMLKLLAPCADRIILTKAAIDRSIDPAILEQDVKKFVSCPVTIIENVKSAVDYALEISKKEDAVCVAGSLYVVGEAKEKFDLPLDQNPKIK
jgi:dihydrofolate synthase/folylpolyglutamate synthase